MKLLELNKFGKLIPSLCPKLVENYSFPTTSEQKHSKSDQTEWQMNAKWPMYSVFWRRIWIRPEKCGVSKEITFYFYGQFDLMKCQ